ncbi:lipoxygenase homology domain-containing protein 1-like [Acipenser ruthenus]|uniref:lipoxygenase homology domain-containing protein 1-like n=1 Tax=Acipenser ruthenus TaxID=7906 RepID=UPI0027426268|nr:lipoxygenase homology domain-containing protein 1-like [Acipenser ruthenus]
MSVTPHSSESGLTMASRPAQFAELITTKRVCFYKSGDPQFRGLKMIINNRTFKTFDALLDTLSKRVPLPFGVRNISTPRGIHVISTLDELEDGKSYICSDQKKVKPIDLEVASKKPKPWHCTRPVSGRRRAIQLKKQNEGQLFQRENSVVVRTPKKIVVFKNGDAGIKHTLMLQKKTAQTFESLLDLVTEVMQFPVLKLYTPDGRRVDGLQALILCSGVVVATGREPFKAGKYDPQRQSLPTKLPGISNRVNPKPINKIQQRNLGRWKVSVLTSALPLAGTSSQVYIILYGDQGNSGSVYLYGNDKDLFQSGHEDIFEIKAGNIGELYKIRIGHNNSGESPGWHCDEVRLQNLFTEEMFFLPVNYWLSRDENDGEICREVPVLYHGRQVLPVTVYEAHVVTGDLWNAGTEANVYITVYGEKGDTGSRQLLNSRKPIKFCKGQTDIFTLEAVNLGSLRKVVIGHNGLGQGNGWFLEKVVLIDSWKDMEYTFLCNRWLDQGEEDGKIVRELYTADSFTAKQELEHKIKEIWAAERWKFQKGNIVQLCCRLTGKCVCLYPDGTVDALGDKKDTHGYFDMTVKRGNIRVFHSLQNPHLALSIDQNRVTALENGGTLCELQVCIQPSRFVTLESVRIPGFNVTFNPEGSPADGATSYSGLSREFVVHVKGVLRNGAVVLLNSSLSQSLCITRDGQCVGTGKQAEESYLRVHKISSGVYMFESVQTPKMYLKIKDGRCDGTGTGDQYCQFKVEKHFQNGSLSLESLKMRGMYIGLLPDGRAKPLVHTGETNIMFYPQVIKYGREKPTGTSANLNKETKAEQEPVKHFTPAPPASPISHRREIKNRRVVESLVPSGDQWSVSVLTGSEATQAGVFLWVYGDQGVAGPIMLGRANRTKLFVPGQEDAFQVNISNTGKIYKIRIGHDGSSDQPHWKLQKVTMRKIKGGPTLKFDANKWLSRDRGNGEIECELPVIREKDGKPVHPVVQYQVNVYTGHLDQAETQSPVFICLYGERGDTGLRLLHKSDLPCKLQRGQVDLFQLEAVSLGKLQRVLLRCEAQTKSQYWYCEKVIIRESGEDSEYIFNCERWLPYSSQGIVKSDVELLLQEIRINVHSSEKEKAHAGDWKVTVVTGDFHSASTEATVFLFAYGDIGESGPIILGSGKHQLFNPNSADTFQINLKDLGELYKLRIGHDNTGEDPGWYLEEVILHELATQKEMSLPVRQWLAEDKDVGDVWKELAVHQTNKKSLPVLVYQVYVYTGSRPGADTDSAVYINIFGSRGDTGKRKLHKSVNQKVIFQQGQVDIFSIEAVSLAELRKVVVEHRGTGPGNGWFLEKVIIKFEDQTREHESVFLCNRWLDEYQDDGKTERELFVEGYQTSKEDPQKGKWKILVKTSKDSPVPKEMKATIVIYGSEGKSNDIILSSNNPAFVSFLPGARDEFLVDAGDVGDVYKIRVSCDELTDFEGWHFKFIQMEELHTGKELNFDCNCWLSLSLEDTVMVKEFPLLTEGQKPLQVNQYLVSVHTGDTWGAETYSNVYITLYGERGDTGVRKLHRSLVEGQKFQRNKVDSFLLEAVSLGHLKKVVVGHDGEGYGAGMYLKLVTVQESERSSTERVFPCFKWLDEHIGTQSTVCKLKSVGERLVSGPKQLEFSGVWFLTLSGSEVGNRESPVQLALNIYGDKGYKKLRLHVTGQTLQLKEELADVGTIYKVSVSSKPDYIKQSWKLNTVLLENHGARLEMRLDFNCWFKDNAYKCIELPALYPKQDPLPVVEYTVHVYTGDVKNAGFSGKVYLCLHGDRGDTGKWWLTKSSSDQKTFTRGQADVFKIEAVHLGKINQLVIGHKDQNKDDWFLEKVIVTEGEMPTTQHIFVHNDWIDKHPKKKGFCEVAILVKETTEIWPNPMKESEAMRKQQWSMWVKATVVPDRMADLFVIVFGTEGKSPLTEVENLEDKPFQINTGDIGEVLKVSFLCKSSGLEKSIKLEKLRMKDSVTKQELGFHTADRWLFEETDSVTELAAIRPDRPPLRDVFYSVKVYTGDLPAAGTDASIFITLFGETGNTCKRTLTNPNSPLILEKGQVNVFRLRAVDLGIPSRVVIGHTSAGYGAGWYLDRVTVQEVAEKDTEFVFPCQRWLDSGTGDRWTERELRLLGKVNRSNRLVTADPQGDWDVYVVTGDISVGGVDSEVTLEVCCEKGTCPPLILPRASLTPGHTYKSSVQVDHRLGTISKVRLQMEESRNGKTWYCHKVKLQHRITKECFEFPFFQILGHQEESTVLELPVIMNSSDFLTVKEYTIIVTTGNLGESGTDADVFVTLSGSLGDTGKRKLHRKRGNSLFSKEKVDIFRVEAVDIGRLEQVTVEKGRGLDWYLDKIVVKEGIYGEKEAVFVAEAWLKDTNRTIALPLTAFQENSSMAALPPGSQQMTSDGIWRIHLKKPSIEELGNTLLSVPDMVMVLYGTGGKSRPLTLERSESQINGSTTTYEINLQEDLGELYKVRVGLRSPIDSATQVFLHSFRMQNTHTLDSFICAVNETLPLSSSGDRWIEIPVEWPLKPSLPVLAYHVTVFSSDFFNKSSPAQVSLCVHGRHGDTGDRPLLWPLYTHEQKEGVKEFTFEIGAVQLGELNNIVLSISSKKSLSVNMKEVQLREATKTEHVYVFKVNEEFYIDANKLPLTKEVPLSTVVNMSEKEQPKGTLVENRSDNYTHDKEDRTELLVRVYTGNVQRAGTDANVHIILFGDKGASESVALTKPLERQDPFEKGQTDTFKIKTRSVGRLYKIEIGHDGKGLGSGWFLEKVEITPTSSETTYVFPCSRWLSVDGDKEITLQIHLGETLMGNSADRG